MGGIAVITDPVKFLESESDEWGDGEELEREDGIKRTPGALGSRLGNFFGFLGFLGSFLFLPSVVDE